MNMNTNDSNSSPSNDDECDGRPCIILINDRKTGWRPAEYRMDGDSPSPVVHSCTHTAQASLSMMLISITLAAARGSIKPEDMPKLNEFKFQHVDIDNGDIEVDESDMTLAAQALDSILRRSA